MNQGHLILALGRLPMAAASATGAIHNDRASLTVVATASATAPYFIPAPTTELVSWMASAAHNPNCCCVSPTALPITGNRINAAEFKMKTVAREIDISSLLASTTGPTAAIALPPQIAVPTAMRKQLVALTLKILPKARPPSMTKLILKNV